MEDELLDDLRRLVSELRDAESELDRLGAWRALRPLDRRPPSPDVRDWAAIENAWQRRDELEAEIVTLLHL